MIYNYNKNSPLPVWYTLDSSRHLQVQALSLQFLLACCHITNSQRKVFKNDDNVLFLIAKALQKSAFEQT